MEGHKLHPLSLLAALHPHLHALAAAKYKDRSHLSLKEVSPLGCLWTDVVFFSPVHPQEIYSALRKLGQAPAPAKFFEIPHTVFDPSLTTILVPEISIEGKTLSEQPVPFSAQALGRFSALPTATYAYFSHTLSLGHQPLLFAGVPHILYKGSLDISHANIISL